MLFIDNKYTRWYYNIIERAQARNFNSRKKALAHLGYVENHHIVPKSLGGGNDVNNLVILTAREHFICHWLLTKMVGDKDLIKMAHACSRMIYAAHPKQDRYKISSKLYSKLKVKMHKLVSGQKRSTETRQRMSDSAKIRCSKESHEIKKRRADQLTKVNKSRKGVPRPYQSGDKNIAKTPEIKQKIRQAFIEKYGVHNPSLIPYTCEYCGKSGNGIAGYARWHGKNCRSLKR